MSKRKAATGERRVTRIAAMRSAATALFLLAAASFLIGCSGEDVAVSDGEQTKAAPGSADAGESLVHPAFEITPSRLKELLSEEKPAVRRRVEERPQYFLELVQQALELPRFALLLVDKQHALSAEYIPKSLVALERYRASLSLNKEGMMLRSEMVAWLIAMSRAAELDGVTLTVSSAYRSYDYQDGLFSYYVKELGEAEAARVSARPGQSQHQLGTAVDFGSISPAFADTDASRWLTANAWRYGFSLSYPEGYEQETGYSYESWHYRYVTPVAARLEQEFFGGLQQDMLEFFYAKREALLEARL